MAERSDMDGGEQEFLARVRALPEPENYFEGIDWDSLCLPRNILCFSRQVEGGEGRDWSGISTSTGRYDQHSRFVLLLALEGAGRVGVEREVWPSRVSHADSLQVISSRSSAVERGLRKKRLWRLLQRKVRANPSRYDVSVPPLDGTVLETVGAAPEPYLYPQ